MKKILLVSLVALVVVALAVAASAQEKKKGPPKGRTQITFEVTPSSTVVYVDGKKHGEAGKLTTVGVAVSAGTHAVRLVHGGDEMEADVNVKAGQSLNFRYVFEDSGGGGAAKANQAKDHKDAKDNQDKAKKDEGKGAAKEPKKKEDLIDLPPDGSPKTDEPGKKDEPAKPWKKEAGEEEQE
ncbi:MAG: PEGA domain-containing protein [Deltaproteobacteria bacterium]|nr:PEGA domain-containing protein [Deltaproteobacteria bacterium]